MNLDVGGPRPGLAYVLRKDQCGFSNLGSRDPIAGICEKSFSVWPGIVDSQLDTDRDMVKMALIGFLWCR